MIQWTEEDRAELRSMMFDTFAGYASPKRAKKKPAKSPKSRKWQCPGGGAASFWIVDAVTRSEARAKLKKHMGLQRLPPGMTMEPLIKED